MNQSNRIESRKSISHHQRNESEVDWWTQTEPTGDGSVHPKPSQVSPEESDINTGRESERLLLITCVPSLHCGVYCSAVQLSAESIVYYSYPSPVARYLSS
mmetsp:Transcript_8162/g.16615  ORF Transcript_8162/g.16615 Transcript_8162/m.16615 type:complete len:101 (+) Transcript_8162:143-445(+)